MIPIENVDTLLAQGQAPPDCIPLTDIWPGLASLAQSLSLMLGLIVVCIVFIMWPRAKAVEQVIIKDAHGEILAIHQVRYGRSLRAWKRAQKRVAKQQSATGVG